ncbi:glycosyltransferase family 4 protein [Actinomadura sp.]|jgi:glycosyltransferase involved in cell wall biosynthesis|uniref:glycosyltransferase family 4 protein n=1 Tax=Actinomadura sp. TaxID=1989 RepID=UPI0037C9E86B
MSTARNDLTALAVATEWSSANGGLSTLNRGLCGALAAKGVRVLCLVPGASEEERADAEAAGVTLVAARPVPGGSPRRALIRRPVLPEGVVPDVVIGHGRVTGPMAMCQVEDHFPDASRVQVVHVAPDELEWWRPDRADDPGLRAEQRTELERLLCQEAAVVAAVGPRLHERFSRDLAVRPGAPSPIRLDPGFDVPPVRPRPPACGAPAQVLLVGRLEDYEIKGVDLAARAVAHALELRDDRDAEVELLVRGAPPGECGALRDRIRRDAACPALDVTVRPFSVDGDRLAEDLARASLLVMPSRAEAFGLVGLEAAVAGTPVLAAARSGFGLLLRDVLGAAAAPFVVPVRDDREDVLRWGHNVAAVLRDPAGAFAMADTARRELARRRTWAMAAGALLDALSVRPRGGGRTR